MGMETVCRRAVAMGIGEICFTDHVDFLPEDVAFGYLQPEAYLAAIDRCRAQFAGQIVIRAGLEIGEPQAAPEQVAHWLATYPFDFVIGSQHWAKGEIIFEERYFRRRSRRRACSDYFVELKQVCSVPGINILGHLDICKRYGHQVYGRFDILDFEDEVREVLAACIANGVGLEVNSSTLRRSVQQTAPETPVLRWYKEMGGTILTIGSDAHRPEEVGQGLVETMERARAAGFTALSRFVGGEKIGEFPL